MKKNVQLYILLAFIGASIAAFAFYKLNPDNADNKKEGYTSSNLPMKQNDVGTKSIGREATLGAVGDILIHDRVYNEAKVDDGFDFKPMLAEVKEALEKPDILLANQETIVAGEKIGLSSYPSFNSPHEVADALVDAGVDIVTTANNHSLDRGVSAQKQSLEYLNKINLPYVGTFASEEDQQKLRVLKSNGIKIAYLSYTYGLNGISVPKNEAYIVNLIDKEKMKKEIAKAKKQADFIVMGIHWGIEYERNPNQEQKNLAQFLVDEGVDIIFGGHPHVLQPMEWLYDKNGKKSLVVYSLGNFLSGQADDYCDIGGMVTVKVSKTELGGKTTKKMEVPSFYPTYVYSKNDKGYKMVPLEDAGKLGLPDSKQNYQEIMTHMLKGVHPK